MNGGHIMTEIITAAAIGASFVFLSDKLKTKLKNVAARSVTREKTK